MPNTPLESGYRPRLRGDIVFGPLQSFRDRRACFLKDQSNGAYYRIGDRERFLLSRMDGTRTVSEIGEDYQERFGKRMGPDSWGQVFSLVNARALLDAPPAPDGTSTAPAARAALPSAIAAPGGFFTRRFKLIDPNALLDRLLPWLWPLFTKPALYAALALVAATELWFFLNFNLLIERAWKGARHAPAQVWIAFVLILLTVSAAHELGHGLTLRRFGRAVDEMGVLLRYGAFFPYTKIDDVVLLPDRAQQLAVAFSGTLVSLLSIVPFAVIWNIARAGSGWRQLAGIMITSYNFTALLNLVPFIQLDGYHMLALYFRRPLLRADAREYLWGWCKARFLGRPLPEYAYSSGERALLTAYGAGAAFAAAAFAFLMATRWYHRTVNWAGPWGSILLISFVLAAMRWGPWFARWLRARPSQYAKANVQAVTGE